VKFSHAIAVQRHTNGAPHPDITQSLFFKIYPHHVDGGDRTTYNIQASCFKLRDGVRRGRGDHIDLRKECAHRLREHDFDGFAIGGLSVGESKEIMYDVTYATAPELPKNKPRYLMGVGDPVDIVHAVDAGIDMFDCVLPTRNARNGNLLTWNGPISIKQAQYKEDPRPLDENCKCDTCQNYSRAYLRHLFQNREVLSVRLNTYHNLYFMYDLMREIRMAIKEGRFQEFKKQFLNNYKINKT
jgi:queuine tRNA-ribosyltransferase